jgi:hypothetical protein
MVGDCVASAWRVKYKGRAATLDMNHWRAARRGVLARAAPRFEFCKALSGPRSRLRSHHAVVRCPAFGATIKDTLLLSTGAEEVRQPTVLLLLLLLLFAHWYSRPGKVSEAGTRLPDWP